MSDKKSSTAARSNDLVPLAFEPVFRDVVKAYGFLKTRARHTPTEYSEALSEIAGAQVYVKWENQQLCGSFKIRGALYAMYSLDAGQRGKGVVTCSSGNHGQGVALAARSMGVRAIVFVPETCPELKKHKIRQLGKDWVELRVAAGDYDFAEDEAHKFAAREGKTYLSSYEDAAVVSGQGSAGMEMFMDEPDIEYLLVPAGGGGLINGIAIAAKAVNPEVEIFGVQSEASNPWVVSWPDGIVKTVTYSDTVADGLAGAIPQSLLTLAKKRVSGMIEVAENDIERAIAFIHREHRQIIEGAGAVGVAALLSGEAKPNGRKTGIFVSGGNIGDAKLKEILASGF
ncbi:MAG: threonine/serine dehydratase [Synergistaceae bacterium]|jgi:threonine dehydratase|nr:threonine/serine dehydratase [Synergistaceae bacterium]